MPLRILHISTRLILGGSQENTVLSCEGQARLGHEVHLAFGPIYGPEGSMLERVERFRTDDARRITTHEVPSLVRELSPVRDWRCLRELKRLVVRLQPDVVHTHSSKAGILGRAAAWSARRRAAPERRGRPAVVHTIHGPPFHKYLSHARNTLYIAAERLAAKRCHVIVSVADAMTTQYRAAGIGTPEQYVTVRSGMEADTFLHAPPGQTRDAVRAKLGLAPDDFVIGTVARLAELKGHDDLLDAVGQTLRDDPRWKLLWVGDGWMTDRLVARVDQMGLGRKVVRTGLVPPDQVASHIRAMDVLCHPSYREGLPRTVPQALLCGVPVVASDADGTAEAVEHARTGLLVPVGDTAKLADALRWMADHPEQRRRMAEEGRASCRVLFSAETMVDQLERVYADALARAGSSRPAPADTDGARPTA